VFEEAGRPRLSLPVTHAPSANRIRNVVGPALVDLKRRILKAFLEQSQP